MQTITPTVKRVQECTGTANRREAEKFLALRISEVQRGVFVKPVNYHLAGAWRALHRVRQAAQAIMEARRADARQPSKLSSAGEAAGHHAAPGRGISAAAGQGSMPGDIEPGNGPAQAHVQHGGAVGTASGHESCAAGQVPAGGQSPLRDP